MANKTSSSRGKRTSSRRKPTSAKRVRRTVPRTSRRTTKRRKKRVFTLKHVFFILAAVIVLVVIGSWGLLHFKGEKHPPTSPCLQNRENISAIIQAILFQEGVSRAETHWKTHHGMVSFTIKGGKKRSQRVYRRLVQNLARKFPQFRVEKGQDSTLYLLCRGRVTHRLAFIPPPISPIHPTGEKRPRKKKVTKKEKGGKERKIAIVIDDIGNDIEIARSLLSLPAPITLSIFPYAPHAREIAREAREKGYEILMHVPMEPEGYPGRGKDPGQGALYVNMTSAELVRQINEDLDRIPEVCGINNHMGSRFTCRPEEMRVLMRVLKKRKKLFLDSRTSAQSVGYKLAKEAGVPTVKRDVFLDNVRDVAKIREQLELLVEEAKKRGYAVGIGHPHKATYLALKKAIPELKKEGIKFVFVSTLAR